MSILSSPSLSPSSSPFSSVPSTPSSVTRGLDSSIEFDANTHFRLTPFGDGNNKNSNTSSKSRPTSTPGTPKHSPLSSLDHTGDDHEKSAKERENIRVNIRVRPVSKSKVLRLQYSDRKIMVPSQLAAAPDNSKGSTSFTFDAVYGETSSQKDVYNGAVRPLVNSVMRGFNASVLAYGQTSSGKTHTMMGEIDLGSDRINVTDSGRSNENRKENVHNDTSAMTTHELHGVIPRAIQDIFRTIAAHKGRKVSPPTSTASLETDSETYTTITFEVLISYLEIYNNKVFDLLSTDSSAKHLPVREKGGVFVVEGLSQHAVSNPADLMKLIRTGHCNRSVSATAKNSQSSRSHSMLTFIIKREVLVEIPKSALPESVSASTTSSASSSDMVVLEKKQTKSKLNLVDLAGSEKYAAKKNGKTKSDLNQQQQSQQNKETLAINGSLTCLAKVIYALTNRNVTHVPYRESKLTRLLRDSLGGNARTLMIACVNPDQTNELETLNTLRYASRAKLIKNKPTVTSSSLTAADQQRYQMLKKAVRELKDKYGRLEQSYDREKAFSTCVTSLVSQLAIVAASSTTNTPRSSAVAVESEPSSFLLSLPSSTSSSSLTGTTTVVEVTDDILAYPTPAQEFESQTTNRESDDFLAPPCDSNLAVTQSKTVSSALSTADGFMQRLKTLPASPNSIPNLVRCSSAFSAIKKHLVKVESLADDASTRTLAFEDADLDKAVSSSPPSSDNSSESSLSSSSPSSSANSSGIAEDNSANIAELQSQLRSETELVQALEVELGQLRREHEALQGETSSMEEARVLLFKEVAEEQNKNAEQEVAHAHAMKARDEREEELCLQTDALNTQIAKKTAECQELNLALQGERMQHLTEHEEMKAVKDAKERVEKEMLEMQTTHQKQEEESLSKTEEDMKVLTRKYEQEQVEREKALVAMKDEYESKGKESQEKMDRLTMEMEAMKRGFEQKAEKIKDEKEQEMKEMVTRMQEEYRSTEEDKLALVTNELETRTALMNALKEEFEGKEKEREKKNGEDAVAIAKERQERALAEKNDAASREKERKDAAAREEKLREEIEKLKKEYTMKTEDKEKELVSLLQVAKDEYAATLEQKRMEGEGELKKYREKSQAEFRSSEEEKEKEMQLRLEALKRDCSAKLQQKETDMKQEMKELTDKIRAEFSSKEEEKANLMKKEIKRVRKEMKKMKKEYKAKEAGVDSDVRGQMDALRQKHAEKERETKKKMLDGLNQARAELAALKKENAQEVAEMAEKMKTVEEKYIAREQDWELEMKERELKAQAESAHREELRDQEVAAKMAKMENEFIEKEREMQALGAEIETILNQSRATEQKLKAEIEKMKILTTMKEQKKAKEIKRKVDAAEHEFRQKEREITMKMATMKEDYMLAAEDKENEALHTLEEMKAVYDLKVQEREQEIMELKKNDTEDAVEKVLELTSKLNAKDKELERMRSAFLSEELEKEQKMKLQMKAMEAEFTEKASKREAEWKKKVERTIQKLYAEHTAKEKEKDKELRMKDKEVEISSKVKDAQCAEKIEAETKKAKSECAVQIKAEIERVKSEFLRKRKEENAKKKAAVKVLRGEKKKLQKELKAESAKTRAAAEAIQQALVRERERIGERQKEMKAMQKKTENRIVEMKAEIEAAAKEHLLRELSEEREKNYDFIIRINEKDRLRQKLMMQMLIRIVRDQICVKMLVGRYAEQRARMQSMQKVSTLALEITWTTNKIYASRIYYVHFFLYLPAYLH